MKNLKITDRAKNIGYPLLTFLLMIFMWEISVKKFDIPSYILPSPYDIFLEFINDWKVLVMHSRVTLLETLIGLILSVAISLLIGMVMDFIPFIKKCFKPIMYVTQMIPTITIAPLLVIWFGFGIKSKVLCVVLTCFFPMLINFMDGMETIDKDLLNLFKIMKANKLKTFLHLKFPMAMEKFFTGLKISATYAFIAATVAEWLGGSAGLGVYMVRSKSSYALDKVFASTILVVFFSLIFVGLISLLKKIFIKWR